MAERLPEPPSERLPAPPYYAVIFTSQRTAVDAGYGTTADRMVELAAQQPGYLGAESARGADGLGITVSYWASEADIAAWRRNAEHQIARDTGRRDWYDHYAQGRQGESARLCVARSDGTADPQDPST